MSNQLEFSNSSGPLVNLHESTFSPIHVALDVATQLASILGCTVATFPQFYLGLPISNHKLNLLDCFFIIDKIDRQLAGWRGLLLSVESAIKCKDSSVGPEKDELENAFCVRVGKRLK